MNNKIYGDSKLGKQNEYRIRSERLHNSYYDVESNRTFVHLASAPTLPLINKSIFKPFKIKGGVDAGKVVEGFPLSCGDCGRPAKYLVIEHDLYQRGISGELQLKTLKEWLHCGVCGGGGG